MNNADGKTLVRTSNVARATPSLIRGRSTSSSIVRPPMFAKICWYSFLASTSIGCGDQSTPIVCKYPMQAPTA